MRRLAQAICFMAPVLSMSCASQPQSAVVTAVPQKHAAAAARAEVPTKSATARTKAPRVGEKAPLFSLKTFDDKTKEESLAQLVASKPTVLFFGSYT